MLNATQWQLEDGFDQLTSVTQLDELLTARGCRTLVVPSTLPTWPSHGTLPDLVLIDGTKAGQQALEAGIMLVRMLGWQQMPMFYVTTDHTSPCIRQALELGAQDFITLPACRQEIFTRILAQLRLHAMQQQLHSQYHDLQTLVSAQSEEITRAQITTVSALAHLSESRDQHTGGHLKRIQTLCWMLTDELRRQSIYQDEIDEQYLDHIRLASALHDLGKVSIPDAILLKPGPLTPSERRQMQQHAAMGAQALEEVLRAYPQNYCLRLGVDIARYHHERWDGLGYPDGLSGACIPLCARIMAVADVYDALRSPRPYKPALSARRAAALIRQGCGGQFDPEIVAVFLRLHERIEPIYATLPQPRTAMHVA